jgi:hypothetical protein
MRLFEILKPTERQDYSGDFQALQAILPKDFPTEFAKEVQSWPIINKSPYSFSLYDTKEKTWEHTPVGSKRVSDHWAFQVGDSNKKHCPTDRKVPFRVWALGVWNGKVYNIKRMLPPEKHQAGSEGHDSNILAHFLNKNWKPDELTLMNRLADQPDYALAWHDLSHREKTASRSLASHRIVTVQKGKIVLERVIGDNLNS